MFRSYSLTSKAAALALLAAPLSFTADPTAYVSSAVQGFLGTYSPVTGKVTQVANAGVSGTAFAVNPQTNVAYVQSAGTSSGSSSVSAVSLITGKQIGSVTGISNPTSPTISPDGSLLYVVGNGALAAVSTATNAVVASIPLTSVICPCQIAILPSGSTIYVGGQGVNAIDGSTYGLVANVSADATEGLLLSPDGLALYAVAQGDTSVSVISTASNEVSSVTAYPGTGTANSATTSPDGKTLYVSTSLGLLEISTASSAITGDVSLPGLGHQIAASADGQYVYACLLNEYSLSQHRTNTAPGLQQISLGSGTVTSVPVAGAVIALQIPAPDSPLYLLEDPYSIATEDTVTGAASSKPGVATGVSVLSVSGSGNLVAGVSQIAKQPGYPVGAVSLVDTATHSLVGQFSYGSGALNSAPATSIALNSAGTVGYMSILSPKAERPVISAFSLPSGEVQSSLLLGTEYNGYNPLLVATAPDDSALYLALVDDTINICKIALPKLALIICASANFGTYVNSLIVDPSGTALYLPYAVFGQPLQYFLQELDSATLQQVRQVQIKGPSPASSPLPVASAYSAATNSVYLANSGPTAVAGSIARVDLASFTVAETQYLGYVPQGLAATPDGTELLVTGSLNGTQIFDGTTLAPIGSIAGGLQQAIVIAPQ